MHIIKDYFNSFSLSRLLDGELLVDITVASLIFVFFLALRRIFTRYVINWLYKIFNKTGDRILLALERPLRTLFVIFGLYLALVYLPLNANLDLLVKNLFRTAIIVIISWGLYNLAEDHVLFSEDFREKLKIDNILVSFFSKVIKALIIIFALLVIAQEWGYPVSGFIAGLGLGGLAFALAAQQMLSNLFGGIVIILEKPFLIGDWIATPSVEGVVEDISFRSTKVRAFDHSLVTIPNSTLAGEAITNYARMGKRRITFHLRVANATSRAKLETCVNCIKQMLKNHQEIHPDVIFVYFDQFNDSSLDIFIYCFTNTTVWQKYLEVKQDVNLKIMEILEENGVAIAYPSQSVYFGTPLITENR
jgi:MscS family membrane protein